MNLNQLEYFDAVFRNKSFSKAAEELFVTPQAVSKAIKALEKEVGQPLFHSLENRKSFRITDFGIEFATQATKILSDFNDLNQLVKTYSNEHNAKQQIELAVPTWPGRLTFFETNVQELCYKQLGEEINISFWQSGACLSALKAEIVDAAILMSKIDNEVLESKFLFSFSPKIVVAKNNNVTNRQSIEFHNLGEFILATPLDIDFAYSSLINYAKNLDIQLIFCNIEHSIESYKKFLLKNNNAAILTFNAEHLIKHIPKSRIISIDPKNSINFSVYICYNKCKKVNAELIASTLKGLIISSIH